jgi:hypothetical protein
LFAEWSYLALQIRIVPAQATSVEISVSVSKRSFAYLVGTVGSANQGGILLLSLSLLNRGGGQDDSNRFDEPCGGGMWNLIPTNQPYIELIPRILIANSNRFESS